MRIASGRTDAKLAFVAVDSTDLKTRETGLSSFTVYRSRNGGAATAYTTPTVAELSAANMPGVYVLTIDEDTTITSGVDEEEYVVHITQASMAPVTRAVELFRPKATEGNTLDVTSGGAAGIDWGNVENPTTAQNLSATNIDVDQVVASVSGAVGSVAANGITASSIATGAIDADAIADNAIDAGAIASDAITAAKIATGAITAAKFAAGAIDAAAIANGAIDAATFAAGAIDAAAIANGAIDAATFAAGAIDAAAIATGAIDADALAADTITAAKIAADAITAAKIADGAIDAATFAAGAIDAAAIAADAIGASELAASAVDKIIDQAWDEVLSGHLTAGTTGAALNGAGSAGDPWTTTLPGAYGAGTAGKIVGDNLNATVSSRATQASVDAVDDFLDTEVAAIKAKTDQLNFTGTEVKADIRQVNGVGDAAAKLSAFGLSLGTGLITNTNSTTSAIHADFQSPGIVVADQFKNRWLVFDSTTLGIGSEELRGQARRITGNNTASPPVITVDPPFTKAPTTGDTFSIQDYDSQTGDNFARLGAPAGASVSADVAAVKSDTAAVKAKTDVLTFTGSAVQADSRQINGVPDAAARLSASSLSVGVGLLTNVANPSTTSSVVVDVPSPTPTVTDQFRGRWLVFDANSLGTANLRCQARRITGNTTGAPCTITVEPAFTTAPVVGDSFTIQDYDGNDVAQTGDAFARLGAPAGASVSADIATVKAKTDLLNSSVGGSVKADTIAIDGSPDAANALEISARTIGIGVTNVGCTTTVIQTLGIVPTCVRVDQFKDRTLVFVNYTDDTMLRGQMTRIVSNTADGVLTVVGLTDAPTDGETFVIV